MKWPREILERDHEIQNPTSSAKIILLGEYLRLKKQTRVLDVACGQAEPAILLSAKFGCSILGLELRPGFADIARQKITERGLEDRVEVRTCDASTFPLEPDSWDIALCLGASFVWGNIADAASALAPAVRINGFVAIGEPFWRQWPLPTGIDSADFVSLQDTIDRFESSGLVTTGVIAASEDDWNRYESLQWRAILEWLSENPNHDHAADIRSTHLKTKANYLRYQRELLGWAIIVGRKA